MKIKFTLIILIFLPGIYVQALPDDNTESRTENIFLLTPSPKTLHAVTDEIFMIHFRQDVRMDPNESIYIYNANGTLFEEIKLNSGNVIDAQSRRIIFETTRDLEVDSSYYINFSDKVFSDRTCIVDDSTWRFTCGQKLREMQVYFPVVNDSIRLLIGLPENYSTDTGTFYPVAYITDGGFFNYGQYSAIADAGASGETKDYITVGIGYPEKYTIKEVRQLRRRDLVISAQNMLNFINESIIPYIDSHYRTWPDVNTIIGNSMGGYFAAYVLTSYRENNDFKFKNIYAVAQLDAFTGRESEMAAEISDLPVNFYLAVGASDNPSMIGAYNTLKDSLISRRYPSFGFEYKMYEGMPHGEVSATAAFYDAFRF